MRLLLAGFGNVGRRLAEILAAAPPFPGIADLDISVVGVTTGTRGALAAPAGIDLGDALRYLAARGTFAGHRCHAAVDTLGAASRMDFDVLVELTPLSVGDRGEAATAHCRRALERNRDVVTANKGPVAWAYHELTALANERGRAFLHEATVMDGVPIFSLVRSGLRGNRILAVEGILNSTTNVMLEAMGRGLSFDDALAEARRLGVAEADPSADVEGWDAAVKVAILATVLMGGDIPPEAVDRRGISPADAARVAAAVARDARLKQVADARLVGDTLRATVSLREVPVDDPFALVSGTGSILRVTTDIMGTLTVTEEHPDLSTTAYGIIADLYEIAARTRNEGP